MRGVPPDDLIRLFADLQFQIKKFRKDEIIAYQGDVVNRLMILLEGSARGEMADPSGQVVKIEDVEAPRPLAGAFLFGKDNRFPVEVIANEPAKVLVIYREEFLKLMRMNETILVNYMNLVGSKAQFLSQRIKFLTIKTLKGKIAHYLTELPSTGDGSIILPATQQELAGLFGVARPSVARALGELEQEGIIVSHNRIVKIIQMSRLLQYLTE
jgi:CRP-like cAMP-binding protein